MDLKGKNVIYIGGFGGIGQKCVPEFLSKGIKKLAIFDLNENAALMQEWQKTYGGTTNIFFVKLDITKQADIERAYKRAAAEMGHFDVVVNGCGLMNDRFIDLTIQINLLGVIHSSLIAMKYMDKTTGGQGGWIVNISSVAGLEPAGMFCVYAAAKTGVTGFTRSMAIPLYYARTGVGFITICPGLTNTTLLDGPGEKQTFIENSMTTEHFVSIKRQPAEACAKNLVKAIELAKNGAVWLLDLGEMKEVDFPVLWKPVRRTCNE